MQPTIAISPSLLLPLDLVTQAIGIIAKRRAGKSFTARRLAEQLDACGQQIVIIDPKGDWWGIRAARNGRGPGRQIVMLGGERADVQLEPASGELVAKLVVEERISALIDLSLMRKHEAVTFMTAFLENLYRLKAREQFRTPLMLIVDEADAIAPQKPAPNEARMLGAAEDIVRRGGQRGIGCTLITQRAAVLNKNVLTQVQVLVALRTIAPQDLAALNAWIDVHGTPEQRRTLMDSLPSLPVGDAWFWSPGWPTSDGIFERAHVLPIETFDSGATPKAGEERSEPKTLASVDLERVRAAMADVIKRATADDPKALRRRIAEMEREVAELQKRPAEIKTIEVPVLANGQLADLHGALARFEAAATNVRVELQRVQAHAPAVRTQHAPKREPRGPATYTAPDVAASPARGKRSDGDEPTRYEQSILTALARFESLGVREPDRRQVAALAGASPRSSLFDGSLSKLRQAGRIEYGNGTLRITDKGRETSAIAIDATPLTAAELIAAFKQHVLSDYQASLLDRLVELGGEHIEREQLAERAGVSARSSLFDSSLSELRKLGLIEYVAGKQVRASSSVLF